MKKYIPYLIVFILTAAVVAFARNSPAWAGSQPSAESRPGYEISITGDGEYTVGGICTLSVTYKAANLSDKAAVDVPADISRAIPFTYPDNLYLSGCHITHFKDSQVKTEVTSEEGTWEVCFGDRPDENLTIYYYSDDLASAGKAVWQPLPTIKKSTYVCASSMYSGVYAPGGILISTAGGTGSGKNIVTTTVQAGTVQVTTPGSVEITKPGTYGAGGICELTVDYYVPDLSNELHVERNVEISTNATFPDNQGLLYLPGCHVFHYKSSQLVPEVTTNEGKWEICFAAIPDKQNTIYFYRADNDANPVAANWSPLETRVAGGTACAGLTDYTGVYAPVGK